MVATLYYGDEIGMIDGAIAKELEQDPWGKLQPGLGRDSVRTPMQWDSSANSGFSTTDVQPEGVLIKLDRYTAQ